MVVDMASTVLRRVDCCVRVRASGKWSRVTVRDNKVPIVTDVPAAEVSKHGAAQHLRPEASKAPACTKQRRRGCMKVELAQLAVVRFRD